MINNVVTVSGAQQRNSAVHMHVSILPQTPLPSRLPHNIGQSPLCHPVGPCWLSILNIAVCTCRSQTPRLSLRMLCFITLYLIALCRYCVFYKLNFCGNPVLSKFIGAIFPIAFAHFVSLCHTLVILTMFLTFLLLLYFLW